MGGRRQTRESHPGTPPGICTEGPPETGVKEPYTFREFGAEVVLHENPSEEKFSQVSTERRTSGCESRLFSTERRNGSHIYEGVRDESEPGGGERPTKSVKSRSTKAHTCSTDKGSKVSKGSSR